METTSSPTTTTTLTPPVMFLAPEHWSPRYDTAFFTVKMDGFELLLEPPTNPDSAIDVTRQQIMEGKTNHPAYYYKVEVFCAHSSRVFWRRYSQFYWLYQQLSTTRPIGEQQQPLEMPPGTCFFQRQDEPFAQNRLEQLRDFLRDVLQRPGYATDPRVVVFLELTELSA
jgi:hypothetical protein